MLETLLDRSDGDALPLPAALRERYGGDLRFPARRPHVFANFVSSVDGLVSFDVPGAAQASLISRGFAGDLFMLALLRAVADAVVVGAGTVRKEPASVWTPESVFPDAADDFAALRRAMRRPARSLSVVVSGSGDIDLTLPAFADGAPILILTTARGSARLRGAPAHITVRELVDLEPAAIVRAAANESGGELILTEGGPTLLAQFVRDNVLDEIFLTVAPRIVGRSRTEPRLGIVDGVAFAPGQAREERLVSVKAAEDYLFLRFARR